MERGHGRPGARARSDTAAQPPASRRATTRAARAPPRRSASSSGRSGTPEEKAAAGTSDRFEWRGRAGARSLGEPAEKLAQARNRQRGGLHAIRGPHQHVERTKPFLLQPERLADTALDAVAHHGARRVPARDQHAEPSGSAFASRHIEGISVKAAPLAPPQQGFEFGLAPQPARRIEPEALAGRGYSPRRRRPLARRFRSTLRPPAVRLRTRKPCRRARRVFEGW